MKKKTLRKLRDEFKVGFNLVWIKNMNKLHMLIFHF